MTTQHPELLTIKIVSAPQAQTVVLVGEADLLGAPRIEEALKDVAAGKPELIVIDLRNLTFMDSSALHALSTGYELCRAHGHELRIVPGPANVQRLFELTGMSETLCFTDAIDLDGETGSLSDDPTPPTNT